MFMYFLFPRWVPATWRSQAQTSIRAEFPPRKLPTSRLRQQISAYLEENYPRATLTDLAERTGYSLEYLSRRIRELFGSSFRGLLIDRRLAAAEQLLLSTDMNVEEVVRAVGYENQSHFHRMFRQRTGKTPRRFRLDKKKT